MSLETDLLSETLYLLWLHNRLINTELIEAFNNEFSKTEINDVFTKIHSMGFGIPHMIAGDKQNYHKLQLSYNNDKTEIIDNQYNYTKTDLKIWQKILELNFLHVNRCPKPILEKLEFKDSLKKIVSIGVFENKKLKNMNKDLFENIEIEKVEFDYTDWSEMITESADDDFNPDFVPELSGELVNKDKIEQFMFAGKAIFTIRNNETGNRFTFRVMKPKKMKDDIYFVSVLTGGDNNSMYSFFGTIFDKSDAKKIRFGVSAKKAKISLDSQSIKVFIWFFNTLISPKQFPPQIQIWHEGVCGKCGKKLTVPESIDIGLGPICARSAELWQRSKRLVDQNNATGIFDSFKHLKTFQVLEAEKKEKMDRLLDNWEDGYKLNKKVLTALRKVKHDESSKSLEDKIKNALSKFEVSGLSIKKVESGVEVSFKIDENKFKFELFANGKIKDDHENKEDKKVNELTKFDDIFLGKKLKEVKDLISSFRTESSFNLNDKQIVAMDSFQTIEEAIEKMKQEGYAIGRMQGHAPIGIAKGHFDIQKWRNLGDDADKLDGIIVECENEIYVMYFTFPEI